MASKAKASNGTRKSSNPARKARRARSRSKLVEKRLRHMLKRNGLRFAFEWASTKQELPTLRRLRANYTEDLHREPARMEARRLALQKARRKRRGLSAIFA